MKVTAILKYDLNGRSMHREATVEFEPTTQPLGDPTVTITEEYPTQSQQATDMAQQLLQMMAEQLKVARNPVDGHG